MSSFLRLLLLLSLFPLTCFADKIIVCRDANNKVTFTDTPGNCPSNTQKNQPGQASQTQQASPPVETASATETNYRLSRREYRRQPGEWKVMVEEDMAVAEPKLTASANSKLQQMLTDILGKLPPATHAHVKELNFYLMWGPKSPKGGNKTGMRAVMKADPVNHPLHDPAWKNAVIIYSTSNYMGLDDLIVRKSLTHEISHTWHLRDWPAKHPDIVEAWQAAKQAGLYTNVEDYKGKTIASAYALTNEYEYFAELSAMYFIGGTQFPYDRQGLKKYDPRGYAIVEQYWGMR